MHHKPFGSLPDPLVRLRGEPWTERPGRKKADGDGKRTRNRGGEKDGEKGTRKRREGTGPHRAPDLWSMALRSLILALTTIICIAKTNFRLV